MAKMIIVMGQEVLCPDGLGRIVEIGEIFCSKPSFVRVDTYAKNRSCKWAFHNIKKAPMPYRSMTAADDALGSWLSAALDDDNACDSFKLAIREWFEQFEDIE